MCHSDPILGREKNVFCIFDPWKDLNTIIFYDKTLTDSTDEK